MFLVKTTDDVVEHHHAVNLRVVEICVVLAVGTGTVRMFSMSSVVAARKLILRWGKCWEHTFFLDFLVEYVDSPYQKSSSLQY